MEGVTWLLLPIYDKMWVVRDEQKNELLNLKEAELSLLKKKNTGFHSQSLQMPTESKFNKWLLGRVQIQSTIRVVWSKDESQGVIIKPLLSH